MAKTTRHGGVSIAGVTQHALSRRPSIGGALPSHGSNSPQSSESDQRSDVDENPNPQKPAQMMDSHSSQTEKGPDSDANSTDGATRVTANPRSAKKSTPAKKAAAKKANVRLADGDSDDEFDDPIDLSGEDDEFK